MAVASIRSLSHPSYGCGLYTIPITSIIWLWSLYCPYHIHHMAVASTLSLSHPSYGCGFYTIPITSIIWLWSLYCPYHIHHMAVASTSPLSILFLSHPSYGCGLYTIPITSIIWLWPLHYRYIIPITPTQCIYYNSVACTYNRVTNVNTGCTSEKKLCPSTVDTEMYQ